MSLLLGALCVMLLVGCKQKMVDMPRYEPYERSLFFEDSLSMRPEEEHVVSRSSPRYDATYYSGQYAYVEGEGEDTTGVTTGGLERRLVRGLPFEVNLEVLQRGQQQFNIYCSPCHGRLGNGEGMIVMRGLRAPGSFHTERLRDAPAGHFFNVITNGYGAMYSYKARVEAEDRWAIVAYIRALQLSQNATVDDIPEAKRNELQILTP